MAAVLTLFCFAQAAKAQTAPAIEWVPTDSVGKTVAFRLSLNDSMVWNFGDGASDTGASPHHTYASNGNYTVTATTLRATYTAQVKAAPPPCGSITLNGTSALCLANNLLTYDVNGRLVPLTNGDIYIPGVFTANQPVMFRGRTVFMETGAGMTVSQIGGAPAILQLAYATVKSCSNGLWKGIYVKSCGLLQVWSTSISDGFQGIVKVDGQLSIDNAVFSDNYVGISFNETSTCGEDTIKTQTFTSTRPLYSNGALTYGCRSKAGIEVNSLIMVGAHVTAYSNATNPETGTLERVLLMDPANGNYANSTFSNLDYGIVFNNAAISYNTPGYTNGYVTLGNNVFSSLHQTTSTSYPANYYQTSNGKNGIGIFVGQDANSPGNHFGVKNIHSTSSYCYAQFMLLANTSAYSQYCNSTHDRFFYNHQNPGRAPSCPAPLPYINVYNNGVSAPYENAVFANVDPGPTQITQGNSFVGPYATITITQNVSAPTEISNNTLNMQTEIMYRSAIDLKRGVANSTNEKVLIEGNQITNPWRGIYATNCKGLATNPITPGLEIRQNNMTLSINHNFNFKLYGVKIENCSYAFVHDNTIAQTAGNTCENARGIWAYNSNNCIIACNNVQRIWEGLWMSGQNMPSQIRENYLRPYNIGIGLENTTIGPQGYIPFGAPSGYAAVPSNNDFGINAVGYLIGSYGPTSMLQPSLNSFYYGPSSPPANAITAVSAHGPTYLGIIANFNSAGIQYTSGLSPYPTGYSWSCSLGAIVGGGPSGPSGPSAAYYQRMATNKDADTVQAEYYWEKVDAAYRDLKTNATLRTATANGQTFVDSLNQEALGILYAREKALTAATPTNLSAFGQVQVGLLPEWVAKNVQQCLADVKAHHTLSANQLATLWHIATLCPLQAGAYVYGAQEMLQHLADTTILFPDCDTALSVASANRMPKHGVASGGAFVNAHIAPAFPNPATTQLFIPCFAKDGQQVQLTLTDMAGRMVLRQSTPANDLLVLLLPTLQAGVYMLGVRIDGVAQPAQRIVITSNTK